MVETSDDRNGVVVNRARRGTCDRFNKRTTGTVGRGEVQFAVRKFMRKVKQCFTRAVFYRGG